jgi:hypothetical protein
MKKVMYNTLEIQPHSQFFKTIQVNEILSFAE